MAIDNKLYKILEISDNATENDIKKSYRKLALKWHPDRNKTKEAEKKFKEISEAYSILSDKDKRKKYDNFGMNGINQGMNAPDPSDLFSMFFNNQSRNRTKEVPQQVQNIDFTLEELYFGCIKEFEINIKKKCSYCNGQGSNFIITCSECNGAGIKTTVRRIGPMIQQIQQTCYSCDGKGKYPDKSKLCSNCSGEGLINNMKQFKININPGLKNEHYEVLKHMGSEDKDGVKAHLIIVVKELPHDKYKRDNNDLIYKKEILLGNSLIGVEWELDFINGDKLYIKENKIIKNGDKRVILNYGMPIKSTEKKGNLIIEYSIKYPDKIFEKDNIQLSMNAFSKSTKSIHVITYDYEKYQEKNYNNYKNTRNEEGGVQCAQQ